MRWMTGGTSDQTVDGEKLSDIAPEIQGLVAGIAGLAAWEFVGRLIAPWLIGQTLDPSGLIQLALGITNDTLALILHLAMALAVMPAGYMLVVMPITKRVLGGDSWPIAGAAYGVALWLFAMMAVAHWLAGLPLFLDWTAITWMSLVGHIALGLATASYVAWSTRQRP